MNIFISWSGERSRILARSLADSLPEAIQDLNVWMSEQDIEAGSRWGHELHQRLEASNFGILCLTPENIDAAWLLFEAGSLAKSVSESKVVPYRLNLAAADIPLPLAQFQGVDADEVGTRKLVESLNAALKQPIDAARLDRIFQRWWPDLRARIGAIPVMPQQSRPLLGNHPANVFWLGHDLARAIRFTMFETSKRDELEKNLRQAVFHLDQIALSAPDARKLLLKAMTTNRQSENLSDADRKEFINDLAKAKNEVGDKIGRLQPGFRGYPTIDEDAKLEREMNDVG